MLTSTERFDVAYEYVSTFSHPVDLTEALGWNATGLKQSIAAGEGIHTDSSKRPTSKALGFMTVLRTCDPAKGIYSSVTDRIELYRDSDGEVVPNYTGRTDIYVGIFGGLNHGFPETEFEVPEASRELALNSALLAVEQAIDAHRMLQDT
jgi:hypothetical protein